jgi:hypothetical protein
MGWILGSRRATELPENPQPGWLPGLPTAQGALDDIPIPCEAGAAYSAGHHSAKMARGMTT